MKVKLREAAEQAARANGDKESSDKRPASKVTIADIARLAVADRDSNLPSEAESDDDSTEQRSKL